MAKYKIYTGYHENYITDKVLGYPYELIDEFQEKQDVLEWMYEIESDVLIDRDLFEELIIDEFGGDGDNFFTFEVDPRTKELRILEQFEF